MLCEHLKFTLGIMILTALLAATGISSEPVGVKVIIENMAPDQGTYLTPFWVGFHDGTFDTHALGLPSSMELERLAEDGNADPIFAEFASSGAGNTQAVIASDTGISPLAPRESATMTFTLDAGSIKNRYFSYASMVIPSNDAFIGSADPLGHQLFDGSGNFLGAFIVIKGQSVKDAGTEVNDEIPVHTAFFGQTVPDTGVDENGVVHLHPGFLPPGSGGILDDPMFVNADFTQPGYEAARITIIRTDTVIPGGEVSGTWDAEGSPYLIEGDITVPAGKTLTIEPGVVVFFTSWYGLTVNGILNAVGTEEDPIRFTATPPGPGEPGWKGIRFFYAPDGSLLIHCIVENGKSTGVEPYKRGGAVSIENANVMIDHCTLKNNQAIAAGGAIYCINSNLVIKDNLILDNLVGYGTYGTGGGIACLNSGGQISRNLIRGNVVDVFGVFGSSNARGGGIYLFNFDGVLSRNTIVENIADASGNVGTSAYGGGIYCSGNGGAPSKLELENNTLSGNAASIGVFPQEGGGIYLAHTEALIRNTIVEGNMGSGIHFGDGTAAEVAYNDVFDNQSGELSGAHVPPGLGVIVRNNANDDPCDARFNIYLDPLLKDPMGGEYHLDDGSPCIDAGDPNSTVDPDSTIVEVGAFHFGQDPLLVADAYTLSVSAAGSVDFSLDAGPAHAGRNYILLGSFSGIEPGTPLPGGQATLPLNFDPFTQLVFSLINTPLFSDFMATLDGSGTGSAKLSSPVTLPPQLTGTLMHFAYAVYFPWDLASNHVAIKLDL